MATSDKPELVQPPAVQMDTRRIVAVGTLLFLLAFLVQLPFWTRLSEHHHRDWIWTCLAGAVLGVMGWSIMLWHKHQGRTI